MEGAGRQSKRHWNANPFELVGLLRWRRAGLEAGLCRWRGGARALLRTGVERRFCKGDETQLARGNRCRAGSERFRLRCFPYRPVCPAASWRQATAAGGDRSGGRCSRGHRGESPLARVAGPANTGRRSRALEDVHRTAAGRLSAQRARAGRCIADLQYPRPGRGISGGAPEGLRSRWKAQEMGVGAHSGAASRRRQPDPVRPPHHEPGSDAADILLQGCRGERSVHRSPAGRAAGGAGGRQGGASRGGQGCGANRHDPALGCRFRHGVSGRLQRAAVLFPKPGMPSPGRGLRSGRLMAHRCRARAHHSPPR